MHFRRVLAMTFRVSIELAVLATVLAAVLAGGCGPRRPAVVPVSGIVTLAGRPLAGGFIRVVPVDARPATGMIGPDGRFTLGTFADADGCVPGTHGVEVIGPLARGGETVAAAAASVVAVPSRYRSAATSGLTTTITEPAATVVIDLRP